MLYTSMPRVYMPVIALLAQFAISRARGEFPSVALHCTSPSYENTSQVKINCQVDDSSDANSTVRWSLITQDGRRVNLGQCVGMRDSCQSFLQPAVVLTRWYSWSTVTISDYQDRVGSTLACSATHFGKEGSDECLLRSKSTLSVPSKYHCDSTNGRPTSMTEKEFLSQCCKVKYQKDGFTMSRFPCEEGCCGDKDDQDCCRNKQEIGIIVGCSIFGFVVLVGLIILFVWVFRKACRGVKDYSDHKKILKDVCSAKTLDELFVPAQQLVSAPGTIVHPHTNVNGPFYAMGEQAYVMPAPNQPQILPAAPASSRAGNEGDEDLDEENWDRWDGFPTSSDHVGITAIQEAQRAGGDRFSPHHGTSQGESEMGGGRNHPYYYEAYDRYAQPPPAYEDVTN